MTRLLFTNWKVALLWAIGISASVAAFFADGGGHEQLEASAEQIREKRGNPYRDQTEAAEPAAAPARVAAPVEEPEEAEPEEPAFGEPMMDEVEGETPVKQPKPVKPPVAEDEEVL